MQPLLDKLHGCFDLLFEELNKEDKLPEDSKHLVQNLTEFKKTTSKFGGKSSRSMRRALKEKINGLIGPGKRCL